MSDQLLNHQYGPPIQLYLVHEKNSFSWDKKRDISHFLYKRIPFRNGIFSHNIWTHLTLSPGFIPKTVTRDPQGRETLTLTSHDLDNPYAHMRREPKTMRQQQQQWNYQQQQQMEDECVIFSGTRRFVASLSVNWSSKRPFPFQNG